MSIPGDEYRRSAQEDYEWLRGEMKLTMERAQERGMEPRHFIALLQSYTVEATESFYEAFEQAKEDDQ